MTAPTLPAPIAGATFAAVARLSMPGAKRRRVVGLIAAYADAGVDSITLAQIVEQAPRLQMKPGTVRALAWRLVQDGYLEVRRGVFTLKLPEAER